MYERQQRKHRVTYSQLDRLWEFLNNHREIAVGFNKSAQAREHSKRMWETAALHLNSMGEGAIRSPSEWSKYWVDFKAKLKRKNRLINDSRRRTGGGPCQEELSEIELKFLTILGTDYGTGLPGVQVQPIVTSDHTQPSSSGAGSEPIYLVVQSSDIEQDQNQGSTSVFSQPIDPDRDININHSEDIRQQASSIINPSAHSLPSLEVFTPPANLPPLAEFTPPANLPPLAEITPPANERNTPRSLSPRASPVVQSTRRSQRRQRRRPRVTAQDARELLVSAAQARAQAELANSRSIARAIELLEDLVAILRR